MTDYFTLQILAKCGYNNHNEPPIDWEQIGETVINKQNGFTGKVFQCTSGEIVISYSGTDDSRDALNDINMAIGNLPPQAENAMVLYEKVQKEHPSAKITLTGHSLGGSLSQIIAKKTGEQAVTFNSFATGDDGKEYSNITNIINSRDFISMSDINSHPGETLVMPNESGNIIMPKFDIRGTHHESEKIVLLDLVKYKKGTIESFYDKIESGERNGELKPIKKAVKKVYDMRDEIREAKGHLSKDKRGTDTTKRDSSYGGSQNVLYGYASTSDGRWVTINGNHVFIGD